MNIRWLLLFLMGYSWIYADTTCPVKEEASQASKLAKVCAISQALLVTNLQKKESSPLSLVEKLEENTPTAYSKQRISPKWQEWP